MPRSAVNLPATSPAPLASQHAWLAGALLVALVFAVYWPTLSNGLVSDDEYYIRGTEKLASPAGLRDIWLRFGATPQYYPVVHTSLWLEYHLWGLDPRGYHAVNLLLHAAAVLLLWRLLVRLEVPGAWLGAALFAVHPVEVESVAWASERKNVMSAVFALGALLAYLRFSPPETTGEASQRTLSSPWRFYALSLVLYVAALGCKTVTVSTPAVLLVLYWWKRGRFDKRDAVRLLPFFAVGLGLSLVTIWMEKQHVGAVGPEWNFSPIDRVLIAGRAVWFYLGKLLWPHPLTFAYPRWRIDAHAWWQYIYPAAAVALVIALWLARKRIGRGPLAAVLIFGGVLVPAIGFFDVYPFLFSFVADHYQYHASMALLALFGAGAAMALQRLQGLSLRAGQCAVAVVLALLLIVAHRETYAYFDNETLIRDNVANNPQAWAGHDHLGTWLASQKRHAEAIEQYREALRLFPERAQLHASIGICLGALGRVDEAAASFRSALAGPLADEDRLQAETYLANLLAQQGNYSQAIAHYRAALQLGGDAQVAYNLAVALRATGDLPAALAALRKGVGRQPDSAEMQHALGSLLVDAQQVREALGPLAKAVHLAPEETRYRESLALAQFKAGDVAAARRQLDVLIAKHPTASAHNLLGVILAQQGQLESAIAQFRAALSIDPAHAGAQANLRQALGALPASPAGPSQ